MTEIRTPINRVNQPAVVVNGASSGIGRATALELDIKGFRLYADVRNENDAEVPQEGSSPKLTSVNLDVTCEDTLQEAFEIVDGDASPTGLALTG